MNATAKIIGGFLAGAALGVAAGLLLAPESGRKTRKRILDKSKEVTDQVAKTVASTMDTVKSSYNKKLEDYANSGKSTIDTMKEKIKV
ncbi:MAG TPA: YtxH domain-containing protein [Cyclobacteriaceae bacterium]|jgi:gas vesicle protein